MASKQKHDIGYKKRLASRPIREAALRRRQAAKLVRLSPPNWFNTWLRANQYPDPKTYRTWELTGIG